MYNEAMNAKTISMTIRIINSIHEIQSNARHCNGLYFPNESTGIKMLSNLQCHVYYFIFDGAMIMV